jgi:hypothetical protein
MRNVGKILRGLGIALKAAVVRSGHERRDGLPFIPTQVTRRP